MQEGSAQEFQFKTGAVEFPLSTVCVPLSKPHDVLGHRRLLHNASLDFGGGRVVGFGQPIASPSGDGENETDPASIRLRDSDFVTGHRVV